MRAVPTKALLACGALAGPLFIVTFLLEGATRAGGYDPLRHPVSSLALGPHGWMQTANFIVTGLLTLAYTVGLRRALQPLGGSVWGPLLVGAHAVGLIGAGVFVTDPVAGYPPGAPDVPLGELSTSGLLHDLFAIGTFVGLPIACFVLARRFAGWDQRGWSAYSAATGVVFVVGVVLTNLAFGGALGMGELGGLLQRVTVTAGLGWLSLLAVHLLRVGSPTPERTPR